MKEQSPTTKPQSSAPQSNEPQPPRRRSKSLIKLPETQLDSLKLIGIGGAFFILGAVFIVSADRFYQPSLEQEMMALFGTIIGGLGFIVAITAQLNLIYQRIVNFFQDK